MPRWRSILEGADPLIGTRPLDPRLDTFDSVGRVVADVPVELSDTVLTTLPALFGGSVNDGLVAALALALTQWRQAQGIRTDNVLISMEGHGREAHVVPGADVLHTVGWFTSVFPMRIDLAGIDIAEVMSSAPEAAVVLKRVKEELLGVPDSGIGYGVLRYLDEVGRAELEDLRQPQISFNYLGRFSGTEAGESLGDWALARDVDLEEAARSAMPVGSVLDVNVVTTEISGAPHIGATIAYPTGVLAERDARAIADLWVQALRALATYTEHSERGGTHPVRHRPDRPRPGVHRPPRARVPVTDRHLVPLAAAIRTALPRPLRRTHSRRVHPSNSHSNSTASTRPGCTAPHRHCSTDTRTYARRSRPTPVDDRCR